MPDDLNSMGLEKPGTTTPAPKNEPEIHVIPEQFYGASVKSKQAAKRPEPLQPATPPGIVSPVPPKPVPPKEAKGNGIFVVVLVLILLLAVGGAAYYFLIYSKKKVVCGDGTCQTSSETYKSCPKDCEPPAPICGNGTCETSENAISCSEDCEPQAVCGNGVCDKDETYGTCASDCPRPPVACGDGQCEETRGESFGTCAEDCEPPPPEQAFDTDSDGLSDSEETEIYGSDPRNVDSDGDSFVDINEVLNLFDPAKHDPAQLIDNSGLTVYRSQDLGIQMYRPESWTMREIMTERTVRFTSPSGEYVQVTVYQKQTQQSLDEWIVNAPVEGVSSTEKFDRLTNMKGYEQIITADRRTMFVAYDGVVVGLSYNLAAQLEIRYRATLFMMANSLEFVGASSSSTTGTGTSTVPSLPVE